MPNDEAWLIEINQKIQRGEMLEEAVIRDYLQATMNLRAAAAAEREANKKKKVAKETKKAAMNIDDLGI